jgi:hypothetical protein
MVRFLIEQKVDKHARTNLGKSYPQIALESGKLDIVEYFIESDGESVIIEKLLFVAAELGNSEVVLSILKHGVDANIEDGYGVRL